MKTILAYGDSLTYGANPIPGGPRHAYEDRWPTALEPGSAGRRGSSPRDSVGARRCTTTGAPMPTATARASCRRSSSSHSPLDLVIIMLGTNDIKHFLGATALEAANGVRRLVEIIRGHYAQKGEAMPQIIVVSPPQLCDTDHPDLMRHFGGFKAIVQSKEMPHWYATRADELGVALLRCLDRRKTGSARRRAPRRGQHPRDRRGARAAGQAGARPVTRSLDPPRDARPTRARSRCSSTSRRMAASPTAGRGRARRGHLRARSRSGGCDMLNEETEFSWRKCDASR